MGFSLFLRFDAYQACAYVEKDYLLDDILDAAAELVQKLVRIRSEKPIRLQHHLLLFTSDEGESGTLKQVKTKEDIYPGCVVQIVLP
ncbi:hypothetical protein CSKR_202475, partial [Clonorchis sinensis]